MRAVASKFCKGVPHSFSRKSFESPFLSLLRVRALSRFFFKILIFVFNFIQSGPKVSSPVSKMHNTYVQNFSITEFTKIIPHEILHAQCTTHNALIPSYKLTGAALHWHRNGEQNVVKWLLGHSVWSCFYSKRRDTFDDSWRHTVWQPQVSRMLEAALFVFEIVCNYACVSWGLCSVGSVAVRFKHNHTNWSFSHLS
jgi:hypothetical protein